MFGCLMFAKYFQHHHGRNPNSARNYGAPVHHQEAAAQPQPDLGVIAARRSQTPLSASAASTFHLGGLQQLQGVEVQQGVAAARRDSLPLHRSVQQNLQTGTGYSLQQNSGYSLQQNSGYSLQHQQQLQARPQQPLQAHGLRFNSLQYQQPAVQHSQYQQPAVQHSQYQQHAHAQAQAFIGKMLFLYSVSLLLETI